MARDQQSDKIREKMNRRREGETRECECREMTQEEKKRKQKSSGEAGIVKGSRMVWEESGRSERSEKKLLHCPAESLTAEQLQHRATSGLPCICFTAQPLIHYQTSAVTVTTAAGRLALTPLPNKPKSIQMQSHANATQCIDVSQSWAGQILELVYQL